MLLDLMPDNLSQGEFDFDAPEKRDRGKLMAAMDAINDRFGHGAIHVGSAVGVGAPQDWSMRQECCRRPKTDPSVTLDRNTQH